MLECPLYRKFVKLYARALCRSRLALLKSARWRCQESIIAKSELFDPDWYIATNPDVRMAGVDPITHYLKYGAREGRNPSNNFDTEYYESENRIPFQQINPLVHYELWGKDKGAPTVMHKWRSYRPNTPSSHHEISVMRHTALGSNIVLEPANIAIGIVTYNNSPVQIKRLLRSIEVGSKRMPDHIKVTPYLIDNGQPTDAPSAIQLYHVASKGNVGFAAAHDILMRQAFASDTSHYITANPDGCFHPDCLQALMRMCQAAAHRALVEALQFPDEHPKAYDPYTFDTPWAAGTCLVISRSIFETIGGFDTSFFMYCEDVDLSWRARNAGIAVKICPRALYMHHIQFREYERARHQRFLISGLILARKWGNSQFAKRMLDEMKRLKLSPDRIPMPKPLEDTRGAADFSHKFSFAPRRWV